MLPAFPDFAPVSLEHKDDMRSLSLCPDGVSEYTFAGIYLFRERYQYKISYTEAAGKVCRLISGERDGKKFFCTPDCLPPRGTLERLFETHDYWKGVPDAISLPNTGLLSEWGIELSEDRDNFDYVYDRKDLELLSGKKFHKKRNLVNAFLLAYPDHSAKPLTSDLVPAALRILERWAEGKEGGSDFEAAKEALERKDFLALDGLLFSVNSVCAAYCLGEPLADGRMYAVHFEKGLDEVKGIYQFVNQYTAGSLPPEIGLINREQDLGDEGLRQAKMTYRPVSFVRKCVGRVIRNEHTA